jgi:geranylgeranyl pyrophosphate synthase
MDLQNFIIEFNPLFSLYLREKINIGKSYFEDDLIIDSIERVYEIFALHGKRIRPYALYLMYISSGGKKEIDALTCGVATELQHQFCLIHDDICDRGDIRHGQQTIHELVKTRLIKRGIEANVDHLANSIAMLVGDEVLSWSYMALNKLNNQNKERISELFQEMVIKSVAGEIMDVSYPSRQSVTDKELYKRDLFKTATDTFVNQMLIGACLSGQESEYKDFCIKFGSLMGEVYQIQDDVLDIVGEEGTPEYSDIKEHAHTFLTQYVMNNGSSSDKRILSTFFSGKAPNKENEKLVLKLVSNQKVLNYAICESDKRLKQARKELYNANFKDKHLKLWLDILNMFETRFQI